MLQAISLYKSYENRTVLTDVSLTVEDGEFVSIMGESGSGKSTLLNILAGNLRPDSGEVILGNTSLSQAGDAILSELRRTQLGFVYQSLNLIPTLNGADNILLPLYLHREDIKARREELNALADFLHISHLLHAMPATMSGGERQRVAIARAMIHHPSVLFLDEPTGSLDSQSANHVMELLKQLNEEKGVTVLQVTHSARGASYGKRIIHIRDGRIEQP